MKKLLMILILGIFLIAASGIAYATITANRSVELPKELVDFSKASTYSFNYTLQEYGNESMICVYKITESKQENIKYCRRVDNKEIDATIKTMIQKQLESEKRIKDRNNAKSKDLIVGSIELKAPMEIKQ